MSEYLVFIEGQTEPTETFATFEAAQEFADTYPNPADVMICTETPEGEFVVHLGHPATDAARVCQRCGHVFAADTATALCQMCEFAALMSDLEP